jgi:hypothetical protein
MAAILQPAANTLLVGSPPAPKGAAHPRQRAPASSDSGGTSDVDSPPPSTDGTDSLCTARSEAAAPPPLPADAPEALARLTRLSSSSMTSPSKDPAAGLAQERQRRLAAEGVAREMQQQLRDIAAALLPPPAPAPAGGLAAAAAALAAENRGLREALAQADGRLEVARLVAGLCAQAATSAALQAAWAREREVLHARLEQAAQMGEAMLRHKREQREQPEPWRQQLLSAALAVGSVALGAAAAVVLIKNVQAGGPPQPAMGP